MVGLIGKRGWRGAIGLIAVYAFLLQSLLAVSIVTQAAAQGSAFGSHFVICLNDDSTSLPDGAAAPAKPNTHCPICTLPAVAAGIAPEAVALPLPRSVTARATPFLTAQACIAFHEARAGLTRAPPQNV